MVRPCSRYSSSFCTSQVGSTLVGISKELTIFDSTFVPVHLFLNQPKIFSVQLFGWYNKHFIAFYTLFIAIFYWFCLYFRDFAIIRNRSCDRYNFLRSFFFLSTNSRLFLIPNKLLKSHFMFLTENLAFLFLYHTFLQCLFFSFFLLQKL